MVGIKDSYRVRNFGLYMETIQGQDKGFAGPDMDISGSYGFGLQFSYHSNKAQFGARLIQSIGPNQSTAASAVSSISHTGFQLTQGTGLVVDHNSREYPTTGGLYQRGIVINQAGTFNVAVTAGSLTSTALRCDSAMSALYLLNSRDGDEGQTTGYGLYVEGSSWKSFIDGGLKIAGGTIYNRVPAYALDVTGDIRATGNVIAYSDVRDKENIDTISGSLGIINDIRGVRFDWNDAYKDKHKMKNQHSLRQAPSSGSSFVIDPRLEGRQIGVIAQEVEPVLPELVFEDDDGRKNVSYANLTAVLVEAVKEQQEQIEELKQEVKEIKNANKNRSG